MLVIHVMVKLFSVNKYIQNYFKYICSMTFCFSFEVFAALNPIQVDIKGGGPTNTQLTRNVFGTFAFGCMKVWVNLTFLECYTNVRLWLYERFG